LKIKTGLSGFVIASSLISQSKDGGYFKFIVRRSFRIMPVYLFCLAVAILLFDVRYIARTEADWLSAIQVSSYVNYSSGVREHFIQYFILALSLLQGCVPDQILNHAGDAFLAPAWSLSLEWQFYIVAPLLVATIVRSTILGLAVLVGMALISICINSYGLTFSFGAFLPLRFPFFFLGIITAGIMFERSKAERIPGKYFFALGSALVVVAIMKEGASSFFSALLWIFGVLLVVFGDRYALTKKTKAFVIGVLKQKALAWVGATSYSTYLIHVVVIDIVGFFFVRYGVSVGGVMSAGICLFVMLVVLFTLIVSSAIHYFVEKPFILIGKKLTI
jgi:peptidoglycan/LPS O-acetylase OafA/YrhL